RLIRWFTSGGSEGDYGPILGPDGRTPWNLAGGTLTRVSEAKDRVTSVRQASAVCNVTPPVVRRWLSLGMIPGPPWTAQQLHEIRDETDLEGRRRGPQLPH